MKNLIKKILREQWSPEAMQDLKAFHPELFEGDPKTGTGKKPKGSGRRLYTDEDPSDTVSVKFRTKEDIVDTLNKASFKNKSHKRQSQIINLIHQRVRAAHSNAKDPKTKKRLKRALDYITNKKEKSKEKTKRLKEQTIGSGNYGDPIMDTSPGNVPPQSYDARSYTHDKDGKRHTSPVSKLAFFKAAQLVSKMKDDMWFTQNEDGGESTYYRTNDIETPLKVVGINKTGIGDKVFWAAFDNKEGLRDGSITNYDQLYLRPFKRYEVPLYETARVYKTISYAPKVDAFSKEDAQNNVMYDEDGIYHSGEWYNDPSYNESDDDWETTDGPSPDGDIKQIGIIYDEQQGLNESLIKEMGPSPEENDIISELNELVQSWDGCEEGMPVACRYKNQVQELIDKYKNLPL